MRLESFRVDPDLIEAIERVRRSMELSRSGYVRRALRLAVRLDERLLQDQESQLSQELFEKRKPS
jgi:Ribbon-helix-helix protein, copG family